LLKLAKVSKVHTLSSTRDVLSWSKVSPGAIVPPGHFTSE